MSVYESTQKFVEGKARGRPHRDGRIISMYKAGSKVEDLAEEFGLTGERVRQIVRPHMTHEEWVSLHRPLQVKIQEKSYIAPHRKSGTRIYYCWHNMLQRCTNPNNPGYHNYGGRGITVCEEWFEFRNFYADMGDPPEGLLLDRIDNDGNYEPKNCRWTTPKVSVRNSRRHFKDH